MKKLVPLLLLLVAGCSSTPRPPASPGYTAHANRTSLAVTRNQGPKDESERVIFDTIDLLFKDAPGYRPYREDIGKRVSPPQLLHSEPPAYPAEARESSTAASVTLAIRVGPEGELLDVKIFSSSDERFNAAAVTAVRKWKFKGGLTEGTPDAFVMIIPMEFVP